MKGAGKMTYKEFEKKYLGKAIDFDGRAGVQCVDVADQYFVDVIGIKMSEMPWVNGARDFYNNFDNYPALKKNFDRIPNTRELVVKMGDVVVWSGGTWGHVAIGTGEGDIDWFKSLEQNTLGKHEKCQIVKHLFNGRTGVDGCWPVAGVLRPKDQSKVLGKGTKYTVTYLGGLNIRSGAGVSHKIVGIVKRGESVLVSNTKKVGAQSWGKLTDGRGWICLTGFTKKG